MGRMGLIGLMRQGGRGRCGWAY